MMAHYHHSRKVFQHQADATLSQANPVSGTKYTVLDTTKNVRIIGMMVRCTWTVQPTPLEIHVTVDSQSITFQKIDPVSTISYFPAFNAFADSLNQILTDAAVGDTRSFLLEGRNVKVEVEISGGTVSNLTARVQHAKIP